MLTNNQLIFMNDELVKFLHEKNMLEEFVETSTDGGRIVMYCVSDIISNMEDDELNEVGRLAFIESVAQITNGNVETTLPTEDTEEEDV